MDRLFSVAWCLVPRPKTKWHSPFPLRLPVTNPSWGSFSDSSRWPEFQRSRYRWDRGGERGTVMVKGLGGGVHYTAVNSSSFPSGASLVYLISTTLGREPEIVHKIQSPCLAGTQCYNSRKVVLPAACQLVNCSAVTKKIFTCLKSD